MLKLHQVFKQDSEFSVGFVFGDTQEACTEDHHKYGRVFYINPITVVKQSHSNSRSLKKRWKLTPAGRWAILADAVHEFAHLYCSNHDENYAAHVTELFGVVLKERQAFNACFA